MASNPSNSVRLGDPSPSPHPRLALAVEAVWSTLAPSPLTADRLGELRRRVRVLSDEAHKQSVPAERLLVAVKESWTAHPELRRGRERHVAEDELALVITACIEEFFAPRAD